jgi:hypothetical protein
MDRTRACSFASLLLLLCLTVGRPAAAQPGLPMDAPATDSGGMILYWLTIGPFTTDDYSLDTDYLHTGAVPRPLPGDTVTVDGVTRTWQALTCAPGGIADLAVAYGPEMDAVAYLLTYVEVDHDIPIATLYWSCDDSGAAYVNGVEVGRFTSGRPVMPDSDVSADFSLKKGVNVIMLKVVNWSEEWAGIARLVDGDNHPLADLPILAAPPGKVAPADFGWEMTQDTCFGVPAPHEPATVDFTIPDVRFRPQNAKVVPMVTDDCCRLHSMQIREASTGKVVYTIPADGGSLGVPINSGYRVTRKITFTDFTTPGMYYLYTPDNTLTSPAFVIL